MPRNRFSWNKGGQGDGGWQNADCEFTQLDFIDAVPNIVQPSTSSEAVHNDGDADDYVNCGSFRGQKTTQFIEEPCQRIPCVNQSRYLCTLLPSRKAYIGNPELEHTMSRKRTLSSNKNMATMTSKQRPGTLGGVKFDVTEDEVDFQMDNILSEKDCWEQMLAIKAMAAPMSVKKVYWQRLQNSAAMIKASKSAWWNRSLAKNKQKLSDFNDKFSKHFDLWKNPLKVIEGYYGTGIVSYFIFIRWLLILNFIMFFLIFIFIILPPLVFNKVQIYQIVSVSTNATQTGDNDLSVVLPSSVSLERFEQYENASLRYKHQVASNTQNSFKSQLQDLLQGTGWMELTDMFYGAFSPNNLLLGYFTGRNHWYIFPLAYLLVTVSYFFICLVMMIRSMIDGSRESLVIQEAQFYRYFSLAFSSWDFCITDSNSADLKKMSIYIDIQSNLKDDEFAAKEDQRTTAMKCIMYSTRIVLNLVSFAILVGAGYLIYYVTITSVELYQNHSKDLAKFVVLLVEFLTPITITFLNLLLPALFKFMVKFEKYRPNFALSITLIRSVFVRLASLGVLMATFRQQITCNTDVDEHCTKLLCWETYVGQQLYKLVVVDFLVAMVITFLVETPRRIIVNAFGGVKLISLIGKPQFDIAKHVLDLIYGQTLCWLGVFYCPMLPAIGVIKCLILFYVKRFTLIHNCKPTLHAYKASRSNTFFTVVLFMAFLLSCIPLIYSFLNYPPSKGCGPFRLNENIWDEVILAVNHWPKFLRTILHFVGTAGFAIPCFTLLCLLIYYYYISMSAYKELAEVIKEQLKEEGNDKQYLLARLTQQS